MSVYQAKVIGAHPRSSQLIQVVVPQISGTFSQTARVPDGLRVDVGQIVWVSYVADDFSQPVVLTGAPPPAAPSDPISQIMGVF